MPDRDGLFAAIVITLDRLGMSVLQARALDGPDGTIFDTFHVLPAEQRQAPEPALLEQALTRALAGDLGRLRPARRRQPQHLRHFRVKPQLDFTDMAQGTRIELICTDRPGLLADVAHVLREHGLRVHDARIATFGERAEDLLLVSDAHNHPLPPEWRDALRVALLATLDGDKR
ncbi:ACT domain-containing protein [Thermomonas sp. S9]|nr:ACT domain-containing protein [Thermomonas sp. S9]